MDYQPRYVVIENLLPPRESEPAGWAPADYWAGVETDPSDRMGDVRLEIPRAGRRGERPPRRELPPMRVHTGVSEKDALDARRQPSTGAAEEMNTILVTPFDEADTGDDPEGSTWGLSAVRADLSRYTGAGVTVAVLDTGIDREHEAFQGVTIEQADFTGEGAGDQNGHGTHCAATFFGRPVSGVRIGVAPGVTHALDAKILGQDRAGTTEAMFKGLRWALDKGARVISLSLGLDFPGYVKRLTNAGMPADLATSRGLSVFIANLRLIDNFSEGVRLRAPIDGGAILAAACGNDSKADEDPGYRITACLPSAAQGVLSVGALGRSDAGLVVAPFSNTSPRLSAPGVAVKSAKLGGGLVSKSGTSMACPHVAGIAALWWEFSHQLNGRATSPGVERLLLSSLVGDVFAPDVARADRGDGMITAP